MKIIDIDVLKKEETLNLTQHPSSPEQVADGVVEPEDKEEVRELLTIDVSTLLSSHSPDSFLWDRACRLADCAAKSGHRTAMVGCMPALQPWLVEALFRAGVLPLFAVSDRVSQEQTLPDGSVKKVNIFKHLGWVPAHRRQRVETVKDPVRPRQGPTVPLPTN